MENRDIKQIIGDNIAFLRKYNHWTQAELAEKLNYSDKAISKWERGESCPDPEVMLELSKLFNVKIDYFYYEKHKDEFISTRSEIKVRKILLIILLCVGVFGISTSVYLLGVLRNIDYASTLWVSFVAAIPVCGLINFFYFKKINNRLGRIISLSFVLWGSLAFTYFILFYIHPFAWMIFIIGIPLEAAINLYEFIRK